MSSAGSISDWIDQLRAGDPAAAQPLWERYFQRLIGLARARLRGAPRRAADEEDIALSAFDSFCRGIARGRFPQLADRDSLWALLVFITGRKAMNVRERECARKRGGGRVVSEAALDGTDGDAGLAQVIDDEPTPAFAAQVADECRRLLALLPDADLRSVALWKMEGYTDDEVAAKLGCVPRTVQRRLKVIRSVWNQEDA